VISRQLYISPPQKSHLGTTRFPGWDRVPRCRDASTVGPNSPTCRGARMGDEGKAVGSALPTALLSEARPLEKNLRTFRNVLADTSS
jgi:hypothetical protein